MADDAMDTQPPGPIPANIPLSNKQKKQQPKGAKKGNATKEKRAKKPNANKQRRRLEVEAYVQGKLQEKRLEDMFASMSGLGLTGGQTSDFKPSSGYSQIVTRSGKSFAQTQESLIIPASEAEREVKLNEKKRKDEKRAENRFMNEARREFKVKKRLQAEAQQGRKKHQVEIKSEPEKSKLQPLPSAPRRQSEGGVPPSGPRAWREAQSEAAVPNGPRAWREARSEGAPPNAPRAPRAFRKSHQLQAQGPPSNAPRARRALIRPGAVQNGLTTPSVMEGQVAIKMEEDEDMAL